jgi:hypothetical protein
MANRDRTAVSDLDIVDMQQLAWHGDLVPLVALMRQPRWNFPRPS